MAIACTLVASACDTSPVAVTVNSQQIKQTRVNADLRAYSENAAFVKAYESQSSGGSTIQGVSPGTFSSTFVSRVLNDLISSTALRQYLTAHHDLPGPRQVAAARAWVSAIQGDYWLGFPPAFRNQLAEDFADQSQFVKVSLNESQLRQAVNQASGYLFTLVCVRQVGFTVGSPDGKPDFSASLAEAKAATAGGKSLQGGAVNCYSPKQLEAQGNPFYSEVVHAHVGKPVAPHRTAFGYQVIEVTDRNQLPFNEGMKKVTSLVAQQETGGKASTLQQKVVTSAKIWLNPEYGTWDPKQGVTRPSPKVPSSAP